MKYSFEELKSRISLVEFIERNGYVFQRGKGTKVPVFKNSNGDKIAVFNPNTIGQQRYFNVHDDMDRGTIIDFVRTRLQNGTLASMSVGGNIYKEVSAVLHHYLNEPFKEQVSTPTQTYSQTDVVREAPITDFSPLVTETLEDKNFLYARCLSDYTLNAPLFQNRVFNMKDSVRDVAFFIWDANGNIVGLERRNRDKKLFLSGSRKSIGVWHSNIPQVITKVFLAETPLDCMAHYQLTRSENTLYFSFGGMLCSEQMQTIKSILLNHKDRLTKEMAYVLGTDNDYAGASYDFRFMKRHIEQYYGIVFEQVPSMGAERTISMEFPTLNDKLIFLSLSVPTLPKDSPISVFSPEEEKEKVLISFPDRDMASERRVCELFISGLGIERVKLEKAINKDWNDDLMLLRYLNKGKQKEDRVEYSYFIQHRDEFLSHWKAYEESKKEQQKKIKSKHRGFRI